MTLPSHFKAGDEWRPAKASLALKAAVLHVRPKLPSSGFGMIGDTRHMGEISDHDPEWRPYKKEWIVRAIDVPLKVGDGNRRFAEHMRSLAKAGHHALNGAGAYLISDGRIASFTYGWVWHDYTGHGRDPHTGHVHVSWGMHYTNFDFSHGFHLTWKDVT